MSDRHRTKVFGPLLMAQADRPALRVARVAAWALFAGALIAPTVQLQVKTLENAQDAADWHALKAAGELTPKQLELGPPKGHKGAVARWRLAVDEFWAGQNIYRMPADILADDQGDSDAQVFLHPNMPFIVLLLTPFAALPITATALVWTILKVLAVIGVVFAVADLVRHDRLHLPDWVLALGVAWWVTLIVSDIQHANSNGFVLAFLGLHLWLHRRGRDLAAGASLAMAICLKITPLLFVVYWLYQRNWKLAIGCLAAMVLFVAVIPTVALGTDRYTELTDTWMSNLIFAGAGGDWYPIHVNQSWPGVASRYLLDGQPGGDIHWNPDDFPDYGEYAKLHLTYGPKYEPTWIAPLSLSSQAAKWIVRAGQLAIVAAAAWAIGLRKLSRTDGRRGLHYAMLISAMLLLNQRTWSHHAAILLPATVAVWYAICNGRMRTAPRAAALAMMLLAGGLLFGTTGETMVALGKLLGATDGDLFADRIMAYGPDFAYFLLVFVSAIVLARALRDQDEPYSEQRQPLRAG